ncbi:DUF6525 family protein [Paracoccus sp. Z330]|uniref:DUF6525 family protein n=1 Tax=Paracoccus onchidii TaxID=3017813 RepID=A0ABT4ZC49_9RHOB|nr:DUF6525 family protein [Paracoccus onchidii]MDB6176296.1 DUF6525 family protein [Paracoccus onchidii]
MSKGNLVTSLRCRSRARPMDRYDRLPPELRRWVANAALPWSAASVLRIWSRLHLETGGNVELVLHRLDQAERRMLTRDCRQVWGETYDGVGG